ncbi:MAG: lamin tail domain-containing protein, partial [Candidatus Izemoplasmataceae bacterium]
GQFYLPSGYELVEYGMVRSDQPSSLSTSSNDDVFVGRQLVSSTNEFLMSFSATFGSVKAYLIVDNAGTLVTYYSRSYHFGDKNLQVLDFEDESKSGYDEDTVSFDDNDWILNDALIGNLSGDKTIDDYSLRMQNTGFIQSSNPIYNGIESISFLYARYGTNSSSTIKVEIAYEWDPTNWILIDSVTADNLDLEAKEIDVDINEPIYIKISKTADGDRINIDNLVINSQLADTNNLPVIDGAIDSSITEKDTFDPLNGVTASDIEDGDLTSSITYTVKDSTDTIVPSPGDFSSLSPGTYTITYEVTDLDNGTSTEEITLTINSTSNPLIYSTGFESDENFTADTKYNNTSEILRGPTGKQWAFYYGTPSTTDAIYGSQSAQMRWYSSAPGNLGYVRSNFTFENATYIIFKASSTNSIGLNVSYSIDGNNWLGVETFELDSSVEDYTYNIPVLDDVYIKFQIEFADAPSSTSKLYIDDVRVYDDEPNNPPTISGAVDETITEGDTFDPLDGVTASDAEDGDLTSSIDYTVTDSSDTLVPSPGDFSDLSPDTYTITYEVTDSNNNTVSEEVTLIINSDSDPLIYSTGFESDENFTADTKYNNTSEILRGPTGKQWAFYYGTPSTTDAIYGSQSAQMRWYSSAPGNLGYVRSNFTFENATYIIFKASSTNSIGLNVSYSIDGNNWLGVETFELDSSVEDYTYNIPVLDDVYIKFQIEFADAPSSTSKLYIDDVRVYDDEPNNPPTISGAVDETITEGDTFDPLDGVTASDAEDGDLTSSIDYTVTDSSDTLVPSPGDFSDLSPDTYTITYEVTDSDDNAVNVSTTLTIDAISSGPTYATDLFISEYIEGSSNNKAIEIYNGTGQDVDLSDYEILLYSNGSPNAGNTLTLSGILKHGETYVIANSSANAEIKAVDDTTSTVTYFNGDDAIELRKNNVIIDVFGVVGVDPGTSWDVGTGSTEDHTLVRKSTVTGPSTTWNASEWDVYPQDTTSYLGSHTMDDVGPEIVE